MKATVRKFIESIKFKIGGGANYNWDCYGYNAFILDYASEKSSATAVIDIKNQFLYEVSVCDYVKNKAYKWISPKYIKKHEKSLKKAGLTKDEAWDSVVYEKTGFDKIIEILKKVAK